MPNPTYKLILVINLLIASKPILRIAHTFMTKNLNLGPIPNLKFCNWIFSTETGF